MYRVVLPFPLLPGKTAEDANRIADEFRRRPDEWAESRRRAGVTMERAYLQTTPMGMFVVAYAEGEGDPSTAVSCYAEGQLDIDRFFIQSVLDIHGVNLRQIAAAPPPETIGEWADRDVTERRQGMAFCAPLVPEKLDEGRAWAPETYQSQGMTESRRALGQNVEVVTVTQTPQGPVAGVYLEGIDPWEGNRRFAASDSDFDTAFKNQLRVIFPSFIDFGQPVQGVEEIFDSKKVGALAP